jgi:hypothetical protein
MGVVVDIRIKVSYEPAQPDLVAHANRRLLSALGRRSEWVERIDVRLGGARAGTGALDGYCLIQLRLRGASATIVDIASDPYRAVDRAAERAGRIAEEQASAAAGLPPANTTATPSPVH